MAQAEENQPVSPHQGNIVAESAQQLTSPAESGLSRDPGMKINNWARLHRPRLALYWRDRRRELHRFGLQRLTETSYRDLLRLGESSDARPWLR